MTLSFESVGLLEALLVYAARDAARLESVRVRGEAVNRRSPKPKTLNPKHELETLHHAPSVPISDPISMTEIGTVSKRERSMHPSPIHESHPVPSLKASPSPPQAPFLQIYLTLVLTARERPPPGASSSFRPLLTKLSHEEFGGSVVPTAVKMMKRNPELVMGPVGEC